MSRQRVIEVVADWALLAGARLMGRLTATPARGKEIFAFEYDRDWLTTDSRQQLDPALALYQGPQDGLKAEYLRGRQRSGSRAGAFGGVDLPSEDEARAGSHR